VIEMANLIRRDNRDVARGSGQSQSGDLSRSWDPFRVMDALMRWDPFQQGGWIGGGDLSFVPRFDIKETKDGYLVRADLPGVKESDVDISVAGNVLTVSGRREEEQRDEGEQYFAMERSYGQFTRSFALPEGADAGDVRAELKDGVLTVHVAKRPEVQPKRIPIGGGRSPDRS
jgi:HSP20 family protein